MKYVFNSEETKRYEFPTHINDLVIDRSDSQASEVFMVVVEPGRATPAHKHDDAEQVFYIISGSGTLEIGEDNSEQYMMNPGDVVRIPPSTFHRIECAGAEDLRYLAVDCFTAGRPQAEPSWDSHVKTICQQQGWDYEEIVKKQK